MLGLDALVILDLGPRLVRDQFHDGDGRLRHTPAAHRGRMGKRLRTWFA